MNKYKIIFESGLSLNEKIETAERLAKHEFTKTINKNIKIAFGNQTIWSKIIKEYNEDGKWKEHISYYYHDVSNIDFENDWRFKEVKKKRKLAIFLDLELHENKSNLPLNHIKDYLKYLERYEVKKL